jgi:hypothetical protein
VTIHYLLDSACETFNDAEIAWLRRVHGLHQSKECPCASGHVPASTERYPMGAPSIQSFVCKRCEAPIDRAGCPKCSPLQPWSELPEPRRERIRDLLRPVVEEIRDIYDEATVRLTADNVLKEREECAKACERVVDVEAWPGTHARVMEACAATIRGRKS